MGNSSFLFCLGQETQWTATKHKHIKSCNDPCKKGIKKNFT